MAANQYSTLVSRLASALTAGLTQYTGLTVLTQTFKPSRLPTFTRYCIVIAPSVRPWTEKRTATREVQYLFRVDLYLLCKNYNESASLFGTTTPDFGLFQMVEDVKALLRGTDLSGLLDITYDEAGGDASAQGPGGIDFEEVAATGFDAGEYTFVHRAKIPYLARMQPFVHAKVG